jgi:hypothetical protein
MNLTGTSDLIRVVTTTTADIDVQASWADQTTTAFTPGRTNTLITTATTTTVVGSPAASTQRAVTSLKVRNDHASNSNTVTILHTDGTTAVNVWSGTLLAGEQVQYDGKRFEKLDSNGNTRTSTGITAAGADTQVQFNDGGALGADADLAWAKTTNSLTLGGTDTGIVLQTITTEPTAQAAGRLRLYAANNSGRVLPKWIGPAGVDMTVQPALFSPNIVLWTSTTATAGLWLGTAGAGAGTYTTQLPVMGANLSNAMKRGRWANVVTTTNQVLGQRNTEAMFFRGSSAGQGGFFFFCRFRVEVHTAGSRWFIGMHTATTVVSADPSASTNILGFGMDAADSVFTFMHNDGAGTATKVAITGIANTASGDGFDAYIFCRPNDSEVYYRLVDINTQTEIVSSSVNANMPVNTTGLTAGALASNAALTTATATHIGVNRIYIETDY